MRARALEGVILGAAILAVPVGFWAGRKEPVARETEPADEVHVLFDRFLARASAPR